MKFEILAYKPAPIIINGQGFNESPGASFIDYSIVDNQILTKESKNVYLEKFLIFEGSAANNSSLPLMHSDKTLRRIDVGLPEDKFIYACLCVPRKLHPDCFASWIEILKKTDNTIIWFLDNDNLQLRNSIIHIFEIHGLKSNRLHFSGNVRFDISLQRYPLADLFLDTFIYNSHAVAIEALRMGLPVLTLTGNTHVSRYGTSILKAAALDQLVCDSKGEYVRKAVQYSKNNIELEEIRRYLETAKVPLFNTRTYVNKLEKALILVWENYIEGYPAQDFLIK
jgi:predicted O-linked N-acetylglucosamine transferase (SPINDLY family)